MSQQNQNDATLRSEENSTHWITADHIRPAHYGSLARALGLVEAWTEEAKRLRNEDLTFRILRGSKLSEAVLVGYYTAEGFEEVHS